MASVFHRSATLVAVRVVTVTMLGLAAVALLGWLAEFALPTGVSPLRAPLGELTADGRPYREVFRTAEITAAVLFALACPPLLRLAPVHWQARATVGAVFVSAMLLLAHAVFTLDCAPSAGEVCAEPSLAHRVHEVVTVLLHTGYVVATVVLMLWWRHTWRAVAGTVLAVHLLVWPMGGLLEVLGAGELTGAAMRLQLLAVAFLVGAAIAYLLDVGRTEQP
ncbi:uncharacterized protein DUF998 [Prauserella shujinwangii]|uniref:Uncharacterized protein DUF998 n=1 Tax=Prauserella shujinwangii TaxID=1453103 RepID=A0A2T0LM31_9PSEU|nr:DUF998 domain-containing protein [Prauserella shujinwangii]PRX44135.1 uncharacterized protein DUF998 [Prauserella shujinwangii]